MAELNLKQIIDRLNAEFTGETRKLVFWYDDKAEFAEDMETVELQNAKIYHLQPDNQFYTKYFLERVDKTTNYLIYAPFPKPDVRDNHLEDTMLYSRRFFADRASLLSVDLGIEEKYKPVIEKHIKFFANKERTQRFYDLEIENFNEENILVGLLSAVCKARTCSFEEVVRIVLTDGELVENIYTNEYLACLLPAWNAGIQQDAAFSAIPLQREFYNANLRYTKERTVVIISDAMRYEVGQELFARMQDDPKCTAKLSVQLSVLPSYTRLGMAALLPHKTLEMTDDFQILADGILCDNLAGRQQVLQSYNPDSVCVQFDDIKNLKVAELRDVLTKRQIIYVYHNQIDARGDKANTEDEVFHACEEAVQEIMDLIHRISVSGNTYHFIVTADHGFIYKRDKLTESDKISGKSAEKAFVNRRFIVSKAALEDDGIDHMSMGRVLGNEDSKVVSYPVSSNVFKVAGGGANYVHGGSSPQEMLVPVLEFKMERGHMETKNAEIALVSIVHKITNLITSMDFIQSDAVSDTVKAAKYRIFFLSEDNEKISNENSYVADSREENAQKRIFRMRFTFKNKKYDKDKQYYLVVYDEESGLEQWRQPVIMDIAFADDFGFGF